MTAPLRYRAWHKEKQCYIPVLSIMFDITGAPTSINGKRTQIREVVLERWTGLTDRNGKDIFEGDVAQKYTPAYGTVYLLKHPVEVKWRESNTYTGFNITAEGAQRYEVIGNVHQHVELLTEVAA